MGMTPGEIVMRSRDLGAELARLQHRIADVSEERSRLWRDLSEIHGWSYQKIADEVGLSKPRIQQVLAGHGGWAFAEGHAAGAEGP
jgi:hypothetical protein